MNKRIAGFILSGIIWAAMCTGSFSVRAYAQQGDIISTGGDPAQTCAEAKAAEEERHRNQLIELQKADIDATKDYNNRLLMCKADKECRESAREELDDKRRNIQAKRNEVNAEYAKRLLDIGQQCRIASRRPKPQQPTDEAPDPFKVEKTPNGGTRIITGIERGEEFVPQSPEERPLDWIPRGLNQIVDNLPGAEQWLQDTERESRKWAQVFEDEWTKDPYGGAKQVAAVAAFGAAGKVAGKALANLANKLRPAFRFATDAPPGVTTALQKFNQGLQGASVRGLKLAGKTADDIVDEIGKKGGGWREVQGGVAKTADGRWTLTKGAGEEAGQKYPMWFLENVDGGVIRLKPNGIPNARFQSMQEPHGAVYVKVNPAGGNDWANEAFKVSGSHALPKTPLHIEPPHGIEKYTKEGAMWRAANPDAEVVPRDFQVFTEQFEAWLKKSGWTDKTHIPLG